MIARTHLTAEQVRELLDYDPVAGSLVWKNPTRRSVSEGGKAGALAMSGKARMVRRFLQIGVERYTAHRVCWLHATGDWPLGYLTAKNGDYDDLRLDNFEDLTASDAARRGGPNRTNTSGHRGITWAKAKKRWMAYLTHNYKRHFVGYFKNIEDAIAARDEAAANLGMLPIVDKADIEKRAQTINKDAKLRALWRKIQRRTNGITRWESYEHFAKSLAVEVPPSSGKKWTLVPVRLEETIGPNNYQWHEEKGMFDYNTVEGKREYKRTHRLLNRSNYRDKNLRQNFGISLADYEKLLEEQGGVCAICGEPETTKRGDVQIILAVDHCHDNGHVRGLLCTKCNQGLGRFRDNPEFLRSAAAYIERDRAKNGAAYSTTSDELMNRSA